MAESSLYLWNSPNSLSLISYSWAGVRPLTLNRCRSSAIRCFLLAVVNLPVGDHVVQFVRQRLRFVPLAGGRHDRYGAEQQQGSQQVCGFQQFHGRGRPPQEGVREQGKSTTFCRMPAFFLIFPICLTPQRHITRRKPKRRDAPDSGSDFRAKISFSRFKVQKIADIRNRTGKKKIPGDRIAEIPGGNPPEGGTAQDASRAVIRRQ